MTRMAGLLVMVAAAARAQYIVLPTTGDTFADVVRKNEINMNLMMGRYLSQQLAMQDLMMLQSFGQQRIASGQASTTYRPSERGSIVTALDPATRAAGAQVMEAFWSAARDKRLNEYDVADCHALGAVMSYFGYWGEDPGPERLARLRAETRAALMPDLAFQGMADYRRQAYCERTAFYAALSSAWRTEAGRRGPGPDRDALIRSAQGAGSRALKDLWTQLPLESAELVPGGFGNRTVRQSAESGTISYPMAAPGSVSARAASFDRLYGAGAAARLLGPFQARVSHYGGARNDLPDIWATAYSILIELRERGAVTISQRGWTAARDYMRRWALAQPVWMQMVSSGRHDAADDLALDVMRLIEQREANRRALGQPQRRDPITGIVFNPVIDQTASIAEKARETIRVRFVASEQAAIERLLLQR